MKISQKDVLKFSDKLQIAAAVMQLCVALKNTDEMDAIRKAIPELAAEVKPLLEGINRFLVQQDIDAIAQLETAGIERHYAVALRLRKQLGMDLLDSITGSGKVRNTATV